MDLLELIETASERRAELVADRDELWKQLDANLVKQEPLRFKERAIRVQIKAIQEEVFPIDMAIGAARKAK